MVAAASARGGLSRKPPARLHTAGQAQAGPTGEQRAQEYPAGNSSTDGSAGPGLAARHPLLDPSCR